MSQQIIHELNGKKYLLVEILITERTSQQLKNHIKAHQGIYHGVKEIRPGGFWSVAYSVMTFLIPETEVEAFNSKIEPV